MRHVKTWRRAGLSLRSVCYSSSNLAITLGLLESLEAASQIVLGDIDFDEYDFLYASDILLEQRDFFINNSCFLVSGICEPKSMR